MEEENKRSFYLELFITFLKIGAFTFGGGYAMIPLIRKEAVEKRDWISEEEMLDIVAVAESTPGPIAINSATFVGSKVAGVMGAVSATIGVALPSFFIILLLASVMEKLQKYHLFQTAFIGVRAGILALILQALITMKKQCPKDTFSYCLILMCFLLVGILKVNTIVVIILCGFLGVVVNNLWSKGRKCGQL